MEEEPGESFGKLLPAVNGVPDDRVAGRGEMDPDLVGPPRNRPDLEEGRIREGFEHPEEGLGFPGALRMDRDPLPLRGVPADGPVDTALGLGDPAVDEAQVDLPDLVPLELAEEGRVGLGERATTMTPEVSLSRRWTIPGRSSGPTPAISGKRARRALTSVPSLFPAPGWTTRPEGLSRTTISSSA